jgi:hypothetical protein
MLVKRTLCKVFYIGVHWAAYRQQGYVPNFLTTSFNKRSYA